MPPPRLGAGALSEAMLVRLGGASTLTSPVAGFAEPLLITIAGALGFLSASFAVSLVEDSWAGVALADGIAGLAVSVTGEALPGCFSGFSVPDDESPV